MPKPEKGEKKNHFISRAIEEFRKEGISQKEAVGRAYGFWESYAKPGGVYGRRGKRGK